MSSMNTTHKQSGYSILSALILVALLIGGGILYYRGAKLEKEVLEEELPPFDESSLPPPPAATPPVEIGAEDEMMAEEGSVEARPFKEFTITAKNFEYSIKEVRVKKGDFVRINFSSTSGFHDWVVDEFNAHTKQVNAGQNSTVDFVADTSGTFEFYCSVGSHRQMGMVGKLVVEE